jgi:hypothetical protein
MKRIKEIAMVMNQMLVMALVMIAMMTVLTPAVFAYTERFEDKDVAITSKLPPQYIDYQVAEGSSGKNVPMYYKVAAFVPGLGETSASRVLTAYSAYAGLTSTNSLRILWAPISSASYYKLYRSADNSSFYLIASVSGTTYLDEGTANGAAYSAPSPRGGNLTVEDDVTVGDDISVGGDITVTGTISAPLAAYTLAEMNAATVAANTLVSITNGAQESVCKSTGTRGGFIGVSSSTVHCQ